MLWSVYPLLVFFVIVVTGNHFWFDAAAGRRRRLRCAALAARQLARLRPARLVVADRAPARRPV